MKILIIHCAYQYKGGEDTVVEEETKLLRGAGHVVELLRFTNEGNTLLKILQLSFNFSSYLKAKKKIKRFLPDVIHIHNLHFAASPSVIYAAKHSRVPFVCTLHNYRLLCPSAILFHKGEAFLDSLSRPFPWKAVRAGVYKNSRLLSFWMALSMQVHHWLGTWKLPHRYVVLSEHAKKIFLQSKLRLEEEQFVVKPNFCFAPQQLQYNGQQNFLFVGRLSLEKGVPLLLRIFSSSAHHITLAGDGPLKEQVIEYAKKYPNIRYAGSLKKPQLTELMQGSSALVFPSIWYEGMPLTIIEAFSNGLPVMATKLGAMEYMVTPEQDGLLFEAGNESDLKGILAQWHAMSPGEKALYRQNARATYENFYTPEKNAEQLLAIYHSVQREGKEPSLAFAN